MSAFAQQPTLTTKTHFEILDGLRGIAAVGVVVFHFIEMYTPHPEDLIAHAYLAVDFFFCLSGFVVAYAYDDRLPQMGLKTFFKQRLIRLHPLVVLGTILGVLAFIFDPFGSQWETYSGWKMLGLFFASVLMIPYPIIGERAFNNFGLNAPAWTLFWEYVANIAYALVLQRLKRVWLLLLAVLAAIGIFYVANTAGNISGGWSKDNFWHGGARVAFSFIAGMCIFRYQLIIKNNLGFPILALLLAASFFVPFRDEWNWITEPLIIVLYFPLLVALGAGAALNPAQQGICRFSGQISYPLYITHYFVLWSFGNYYGQVQPTAQTLAWVIPSLMAMQLVVAYLAMKFYDLPIRKWLSPKNMPRN
ncbi:acyltransferase family protein [Pedobacter nanyangensis]|uniref:acyltransferase family protein n=1 Tax=Pedobacter nanyangensis TaxID=1562389 RepID=UPI000DE398B2|nr:acyltransferase [Pedobacter nanyangensis]